MSGAGDRILDNGLLALTTESDRVFLCATDPVDYTAASTVNVGSKIGSRGSMFFPLSSVAGGRMASMSGFNDGNITSNGNANYVVVADSINQRILVSEALAVPKVVKSGGLFSINALDIVIGKSSQPQASSFVVASPVIGVPVFTLKTSFVLNLTTNPPVFGQPILVPNGVIGFFNTPFQHPMVGDFNAQFDAVPSALNLDTSLALSATAASALTDLACIVWFSTSGNAIQVRNGAVYSAAASVIYVAGQSYHFRIVGNISTHLYSVWVTPPSQAEILLASNYSFRSEQSAITALNNFCRASTDSGGAAVSNLVFNQGVPLNLAVGSPQIAAPVMGINSPTIIGEQSTAGFIVDSGANIIRSAPFSLAQQATAQTMSCYIVTAGGQLRLGIYSDNAGVPGTKLAETAAFTPTTGWNTAALTTLPAMAVGTYHLVFLTSSNTLQFAFLSGPPNLSFVAWTFGALPATWPAGSSTSTGHWAVYATLQVGSPVTDTLPLPLLAWEGGASYYAQFTLALQSGWTDPNFFPIGVFLSPTQDPYPAKHKTAGVNFYLAAEHTLPLSNVTANGISVMPQMEEWTTAEVGSNVLAVSWFVSDEPDMNSDLATVQSLVATANGRNDGRFTSLNIGNGVDLTFWSPTTVDDMVRAVNLSSVDQYCYTSPGVRGNVTSSPNWPPGANAQSSAAYGWLAGEMRKFLVGGPLKPVMVAVETARPLLGDAVPGTITIPQIEGAVWAAIRNEARGIVFFQHNNDPAIPFYSLADSPTINAGVANITAKIKTLAPVLNSQTYIYNFANGTNTMLKAQGGFAYIFAGIGLLQSSGSKTFTVPSGIAVNGTVVVVGESRNLTITNGSFTDTFAAESSEHVYKIPLSASSTSGPYTLVVANFSVSPLLLNRPGINPPTGSGLPNASTTGVPAGTTLTVVNGDFNTSSNNQVVTALDIRGTCSVNHSGVTLQSCKIGMVYCSGPTPANLTLQDCKIVGIPTWNSGITIVGSGGVLRRCDVSGVERGIWLESSNSLIEDCYFHGLINNTGTPDPHIDGIQIPGQNSPGVGPVISNVIIRRTNIDCDAAISSAVTMRDGQNVDISLCQISGGTYCMYVEGNSTGCDFTNNYFGAHTFGWYAGASVDNQNFVGNIFSNTAFSGTWPPAWPP